LTIEGLAAVLAAEGVLTISIRTPAPVPSDADPRSRDYDKFLVSLKRNNWHFDWTRGKPKATLLEALESALGRKLVEPPKKTVNLGDLL
jgi:hypothetical protein